MSGDVCEVVITGPDPEWLAGFTRRLVEDRLCACGQVIPEVRSIYRWRGEISDEHEARVALHTRLDLVPEIMTLVERDHPYEVACVLALPVVAGDPGYLRWVRDETRDPRPTLAVDEAGTVTG